MLSVCMRACVCNADAGMGAVDVAILDPQGNKDTARPTITQKADGVWSVEYSATTPGLHSVNVFFAGKAIPNSPFGVVVTPGLPLVYQSQNHTVCCSGLKEKCNILYINAVSFLYSLASWSHQKIISRY